MQMSGNVDVKMRLLDPTMMVRRLPSSLARNPHHNPPPHSTSVFTGVLFFRC